MFLGIQFLITWLHVHILYIFECSTHNYWYKPESSCIQLFFERVREKSTKCKLWDKISTQISRFFLLRICPSACPSFLLCLQLLTSAGSYDLRLDEYRDLVLKCWSKFYGCCHEYQRVKFKVHSPLMGCIF